MKYHLPPVFITILLLSTFFSYSQKGPSQNLVPNPSFEEYSDDPSGWYYSGKDFSRVAMYWTSPTAASPDIFGPKVRVPPSWAAAGFGKIRAYKGTSYAGITVYGCNNGKPHCREYIQIQLAEPLIPGQRYAFSCMLAQLPNAVATKNISLWFCHDELERGDHDPLVQDPFLTLDRFIPSDGKWYRWTGQFTAAGSESYLLIGNFKLDQDCQVKMPARSDLRFGYYYIDDVSLYKIPPFMKAPEMESPLRDYIPRKGETIVLSRIYFEHDRTDFLSQAMFQLRELLAFLQKYPTLRIEIIGHTDDVGTPEYNQQLSLRRSGAVSWWLRKNGVAPGRLETSGYGATRPADFNGTSSGRSHNRRVEIKVLSL